MIPVYFPCKDFLVKKILTISLLSLIFTLNAHSESYRYGSLGLTKNIADNPHDLGGFTYGDADADDEGSVISYGFGTRSGNLALETEFSYYEEVTLKLERRISVDVTTFSIMENIMYTSEFGSNGYILAGLGLGLGHTNVNTSARFSSSPFDKDNDNTDFAHQIILGYGMENYEIVFKQSEFGIVKGGSGTTSAGSRYNPELFDNRIKSISLRYKF
tara:strand:+ start:890 stop:1537 length:648 start_codon:yes stop_codon:yes gene_type:complete